MDVRLPDGTVLTNIPEGTTKAQIIDKLKRNGYDTSSLEGDDRTIGGALTAIRHEAAANVFPLMGGLSSAAAVAPASGALAATWVGAPGAAALEIGAGVAGSAAAAKAQEEFLKAHPKFAEAVGLDEKTRAEEAAKYGGFQEATSVLMNLVTGKLTKVGIKALFGYGEEAAKEAAKRGVTMTAEEAVTAARKAAAVRAGLMGGVDVGMQVGFGDQPFNARQALESAAVGALGERPSRFGRALEAPGRVASRQVEKLIPEKYRPAQKALSAEETEEVPLTEGEEKTPEETEAEIAEAIKTSAEEKKNAPTPVKDISGVLGAVEQEVPVTPAAPEAVKPVAEVKAPEETVAEIKAPEEPVTPVTQAEAPEVLAAREYIAKVKAGEALNPFKIRGVAKSLGIKAGPRDIPAPGDVFAAVDKFVNPPEAPKAAEEAKPAEVKEEPLLPPEVQAAKDFLVSVDAGGIPLNPAIVRKIAEDLGLEVKGSEKPEDITARVRSAVERTEPTKATEEVKEEEVPEEEDVVRELSEFEPSGVSEKDIEEQTGAAAKEAAKEAPKETPKEEEKVEPEVMRQPATEANKPLQDALMAGDLGGVLEHLSSPGVGAEVDELHQSLAKLLRKGPSGYGERKDAAKPSYKKVKLNVEGAAGHDAEAIDRLKKSGKLAEYDPATNTIHVTKEGTTNEVVLHEAVHAATVRTLREFELEAKNGYPTRKQLQDAVDKANEKAQREQDAVTNAKNKNASAEKIKSLVEAAEVSENEAVKAKDELDKYNDRMAAAEHINTIFKTAANRGPMGRKLSVTYPEAFRSVYEFVSYGMSNRAFQEDLAKVRVDKPLYTYGEQRYTHGLGGEIRTLWTEFTQAIARVMGIKRGGTAVGAGSRMKDSQARIEKTMAKINELTAQRDALPEGNKKREELNDDIEEYKEDLRGHTEAFENAQKAFKASGKDRAEGNMLLELTQSVSDILRTPTQVKGVKPLAAVEPGGEPKKVEGKKPKKERPNPTLPEIVKKRADINQAKVRSLNPARRIVDSIVNKFGIPVEGVKNATGKRITLRSLIKNFQNNAIFIKDKEQAMKMAGTVVDNVNDAWTALILKPFRALEHTQPVSTKMRDAAVKFSKAARKGWEDGVAQLDTWAIARAEEPLRKYFYDLNVPLDNVKKIFKVGKEMLTPADYRQMIVRAVPHATPEQAVLLRKKLSEVVKNHQSSAPDASSPKPEVSRANKTTDITHTVYDVAGEYSASKYDEIRKDLETAMKDPALGPHIQEYFDALREAHDKRIELLRASGHWGPHVDAAVAFQNRGDTYVPLKGSDKQGLDYLREAGAAGESEAVIEAAAGRRSEAVSPYAETLASLDQALNRANRAPFLDRIYNLVKNGDIPGKILKPIQLDERSSDYVKKLSAGTRNKIILRPRSDGTIDVIRIDNKEWADAVRGVTQSVPDWLNLLGVPTRLMASALTRYNPFFGLKNLQTDLLTNVSTISAEYGPVAGAKFIAKAAKDFATGSWPKAAYGFHLIMKGAPGVAKLEALAKKSSFYKNLYEYYSQGGFQLFKQMYSTTGELAELAKEFNGKPFAQTRKTIDNVIEIWNDSLDFLSRGSAYSVIKEAEMKKPGVSEKEAMKIAAAKTKGLLNLEESGKYGKAMGSYFVLFKAEATGAQRSIEAFRPLFQSAESALKNAEALGGKPFTPEQKASFIEEHNKKRLYATIAAMAFMGLGMASYARSRASAPEDDKGRNIIAKDDKAMWVRNLRIPAKAIFGDDYEKILGKGNDFITFKWGYGGGAFASMGAQMQALIEGDVEFKDFAKNITKAATDSFLPIPVSDTALLEKHPIGWAVASVSPSVAKPVVEFGFNADEYGRQIYNGRTSKYGDAYTGGDYVADVWKDAARYLEDTTGVQIQPSSLQFFANDYLGGISSMAEGAYNKYLFAQGEKDLDARDLNPLRNFIARSNNYDARQFADAEEKIKDLSTRINTLQVRQNEEGLRKFLKDNPNAPGIVAMYNQQKALLNRINARMNQIEVMNITPKEKVAQREELKKYRDIVMGNVADVYKQYSH
jgi:hypothetical protein